MFCLKQHDTVTGSGKKSRVDKKMANATTCLDYNVSLLVDSFSTHSFHFKICSLPRQATVRPVVNPFDIIMQRRTAFVSLPPRPGHHRMYANHNLYDEFLSFLVIHHLGWSSEDSVTNFREAICRRYVEGIFSVQSLCVEGTQR